MGACRDDFSRNVSREHCALGARVVITIVLRVRGFRTECGNWSGAASARRLLMPARETKAIILKTFPLGEADRLVSFFGRSSGRMRGVAAGARRVQNRYGSTLEILSHVQIWYVERETRDLVRIQQADLLESFHKAQSDYVLSTGLAVISEISELILPEHEVSEPMFRLILLAAREVERTGDWNLPLSYFAFCTGGLGGGLRRFARFVFCGGPFGAKPAFYDAHQPGLFCEKCRRPGMKPLHVEARNLAERFAGEGLDGIAHEKAMQPAARELRDAGLGWIEHHLERRLRTREFLEST